MQDLSWNTFNRGIVWTRTFSINCFPVCFSFHLKSHRVKLVNLVFSFGSVFLLLFLYSTTKKNNVSQLDTVISACGFDFKTYLTSPSQCMSEKEYRTRSNPAQVLFWAKISSAIKSYLTVLQCVIKAMSPLWLNCHTTKNFTQFSKGDTHEVQLQRAIALTDIKDFCSISYLC